MISAAEAEAQSRLLASTAAIVGDSVAALWRSLENRTAALHSTVMLGCGATQLESALEMHAEVRRAEAAVQAMLAQLDGLHGEAQSALRLRRDVEECLECVAGIERTLDELERAHS
jgi:hypothetical protein